MAQKFSKFELSHWTNLVAQFEEKMLVKLKGDFSAKRHVCTGNISFAKKVW
jgi:hypothetical protein